jgi:hypothetical protein
MPDQRQPDSVPKSVPEKRVPEEAIRNRAHEIYRERGSESGHDVEDWLRAERELQEHDQ